MKVTWEGLSHILWKINKCSKPPTCNGIEFVCWSVFNKHYRNPGMSPYFTNKDGLPPEETEALEIRIADHRAEMGLGM